MLSFSMRKIAGAVSSALNKYNKELTLYLEEHTAPYLWAEGGEWPAYSEQFHNLFPSLRGIVAKAIDYTKCYRLELVTEQIRHCIDSGALCAMFVPYSLEFKLSVLRQLTDVYPDRKVTVVVQSSAINMYLKTLLANVEAQAFLTGHIAPGWKEKIDIISPAELMHEIASNRSMRFGVLVLDEANNSNIMYSLYRKVLPYVSEFPVYLDACNVDSGELSQVTSPTIETTRITNDDTLIVGYSDTTPVNISSTMVCGIPVDGYTCLCDTGYRVIPVVEQGTYVTLYPRHATAYEKNKTTQWARVNGYANTSVAVHNSRRTIKHQIGADSYSALLWAMEIVTGMSPGDIAIARRIWMSSGFSTTVILDPISLNLTNRTVSNLPIHMSGTTHGGAIWNIYQYSNALYSNFVYEQRHLPVIGHEITLRIGYETRYGRPPIYRLMISQTPGDTINTNEFIVPKFLKYYYSIINKSVLCGFDILADHIPCDRSILSPVDIEDARWVLANRMLPSYHASELVAVVSLWNKHTDGLLYATKAFDMMKMFCDYFSNC